MLRKISTAFAGAVLYVSASAQDSTVTAPAATSPLPIITGSVDVYYRYNFSNAKLQGEPYNNNYTSFTNSQSSFELGMASVRADHSFGKASATVDLGFGRRAEEFSYGDGEHSTLFAVKQAYLSYAVSDKFKLTMGKWATHVGYELADAYLNRNYSMSYMFSYGPFSHTGLKADIGLGGKSALMLGIANTTDHVTTTSGRKFALAQFATGSSDDKVKAYINYQGTYGGSFSLTQFDAVITAALASQFSIGYNGTVQMQSPEGGSSASWWGSALYLNFDPISTFGLTLRGEYFDNHKGLLSIPSSDDIIPAKIFAFTLSGNAKVGNLTIIPELRLDHTSEELFLKSDGNGSKSTVSAILAATYHF